MHPSDIELWRIGNVACFWLADWRRIRIMSSGETLSDQRFASPSDALTSARELRRFFKFINASGSDDHSGGPRSAVARPAG
jgi:hypothetical protein